MRFHGVLVEVGGVGVLLWPTESPATLNVGRDHVDLTLLGSF